MVIPGIMMFQMLAGQLPFETPGSEMGVVALHLLASVVPLLLPLAPEIRPALAQLVERMLAKAKEERPSMAEVVEALRALGAAVQVQSVAQPRRRRRFRACRSHRLSR